MLYEQVGWYGKDGMTVTTARAPAVLKKRDLSKYSICANTQVQSQIQMESDRGRDAAGNQPATFIQPKPQDLPLLDILLNQ